MVIQELEKIKPILDKNGILIKTRDVILKIIYFYLILIMINRSFILKSNP